jgi:kumamolisin
MTIPAQLHTYFKKPNPLQPRATGAGPWKIADLCKAYGWPTNAPGGGVIAIYEASGGYTISDMQNFANSNGLPMPTIGDISIDGTTNTPGGQADGEVALDIQTAWASYYQAVGQAPIIRMYWGQDIAVAITQAASDGCSVFSCSWGADEANWGALECGALDAAAAAAAAVGMIVFAASGDNDSSDGGPNAANVDCPASCPNVIGCGGTTKTPSSETVWNNNPGNASGEGTGGGYSTVFSMPAWQTANGAPAGPGPSAMRMVPDIAANADPNTGYEIFYDGQAQIVGGTSAVAPLYAGLFAALGSKLGAIGSKLWGNGACFTRITQGDNGAFTATDAPDPCTGLGAPLAAQVAALFAAPAPSA